LDVDLVEELFDSIAPKESHVANLNVRRRYVSPISV
jgi:hypothetical protein